MVSEWKRPDLPSKCTFKLSSSISKSPHHHVELKQRPLICNTILDAIGNTPLVKLNNLPKKEGIKLAKCDYLNPGGSVKDRIAARMILDAEKLGILKENDMLIEPTSGNTGIGLALAAAVKNYRCTIVLPEKMSQEKISVLKALGAEIIRTRTSANFYDEDSHLRIADKLMKESIDDRHILNQYTNADNPLAHFDGTAAEIIRDCGNKPPDMIVLTAGTGGTISGVARKIKQELPNCKIIGVDPRGSILAKPEKLNEKYGGSGVYHVEGIGYDFYPTVLDHDFIDKWYKSDDQSSFDMARRLIKEEGFLCGGSSGSAIWGTLIAIRDYGFHLDPTKRVVVFLADSVRNYMTKFLSDDWMISRGFRDLPGNNQLTENLKQTEIKIASKTLFFARNLPIKDVLNVIKSSDSKQTGFAFVTEDGTNKSNLLGVVDLKILSKRLLTKLVTIDDAIELAMNKEFLSITSTDANMADVARILMSESYCVILDKDGPYLIYDSDVLNKMV